MKSARALLLALAIVFVFAQPATAGISAQDRERCRTEWDYWTVDMFHGFANAGDCMSYVAHGGVLWGPCFETWCLL